MSKKYRKEYRENITTFKGMDGKLASLTSRYITAKINRSVTLKNPFSRIYS
jgi:hypothetical protein